MTLIFNPEYAWQLWVAALVVAVTGPELVSVKGPGSVSSVTSDAGGGGG